MKISMKTMPIAKRLLLLSFFLLLIRCSKEEKLDTPLTQPLSETLPDNTPVEKELKRIYEQYGVLIEYNYNRYAFDSGATADPVKEKDIIPFIKILEEIFFKALNQATGSDRFIKKELPIKIYLIESGIAYGKDKEDTALSQAGDIQANRIVIMGAGDLSNTIRKGNTEQFLYLLFKKSTVLPSEGGFIGFIYHEYTHFMQAKHDLPKGFEQPALKEYVGQSTKWMSKTDDYAREHGFMLPYGMRNPWEDFATYVQVMVWKDHEFIEKNYLLSEATQEKYKLVYDYYKNLGLDLFKLQKTLHSDELKQRMLAIRNQYRDNP